MNLENQNYLVTVEQFFLSLKDSGCGIREENVSNIFDPFFTTKPLNKGTGLGLSVCKRIVENHEGTITVSSIEGKGTIFTITIPLIIKNLNYVNWQISKKNIILH